jgi:hypothetical protein
MASTRQRHKAEPRNDVGRAMQVPLWAGYQVAVHFGHSDLVTPGTGSISTERPCSEPRTEVSKRCPGQRNTLRLCSYQPAEAAPGPKLGPNVCRNARNWARSRWSGPSTFEHLAERSEPRFLGVGSERAG